VGTAAIPDDVSPNRPDCAAVADTRAMLAAIVESSEDAIVSKDLNGIITSWNPAAEQLYGYTAGEMIGRPISMLFPQNRPDELSSIMDRLRRGERIKHFETTRIRKDGSTVDVSISLSPVHD
jgi:PAS domain S-box-containing protein